MDKSQKRSQLKELITKGKEQGYLTYAEVNDHLPEDVIDSDQIEDIIRMINDMGITVHETAPDADELLMADEQQVEDEDAAEAAAAALASVEADFGRTIESYDSYLQIDGEEKAVQLFRLGRLGLFYRTLDGRDTGYWDVVNNNWLDQGSKLDANIKAAIDVANRQTPPNLITLPLKPVSSND